MSTVVVFTCLFTSAPPPEPDIADTVWERQTMPVIRKRPDIAEVAIERFELTALGRAAGRVDRYALDVDGRVTHEELRDRPSAAPWEQLDLTYDAHDRIERVRGVDFNVSIDQLHTYELDAAGRIARVAIEDHGHACHPTYAWASDGSYVISDRLFFDKHDRLVQSGHDRDTATIDYDGHGYPERVEKANKLVAAWRNSYDRAGRLYTSDDGALVRVYEWNSHGDLAEIADKRNGRIVAKTVYTYVYR